MAGGIETNAGSTVNAVHMERENIMAQVAQVATSGGTVSINMGTTSYAVDISSGAGALVLDDRLQELATLEQSAAQMVAAENRAQKDVQARMS
jgi:hypothetical protein